MVNLLYCWSLDTSLKLFCSSRPMCLSIILSIILSVILSIILSVILSVILNANINNQCDDGTWDMGQC